MSQHENLEQGDSATRDGTPLVAVKMSERAAERLAKACREAYYAVFDELETDGRKPRAREGSSARRPGVPVRSMRS